MILRIIKKYVNFNEGQKISCDEAFSSYLIKNGYATEWVDEPTIEVIKHTKIETQIEEDIHIETIEVKSEETPTTVEAIEPLKTVKKTKKK
jgi:hypothetical protein